MQWGQYIWSVYQISNGRKEVEVGVRIVCPILLQIDVHDRVCIPRMRKHCCLTVRLEAQEVLRRWFLPIWLASGRKTWFEENRGAAHSFSSKREFSNLFMPQARSDGLLSLLACLSLFSIAWAGISRYNAVDVPYTYRQRIGLVTAQDSLFGEEDPYVRINGNFSFPLHIQYHNCYLQSYYYTTNGSPWQRAYRPPSIPFRYKRQRWLHRSGWFACVQLEADGRSTQDQQFYWCCTAELKQTGKCDQVGDLILAREARAKKVKDFYYWSLHFNKTKTSFLSKEDKVCISRILFSYDVVDYSRTPSAQT